MAYLCSGARHITVKLCALFYLIFNSSEAVARCSEKFRKIHKKILVLESLF